MGNLKRRGYRRLVAGTLFILAIGAIGATSAYAQSPVWTISSASSPTDFAAGDETGDDRYVLTVVDTGGEPETNDPIEVSDTLPGGLTASAISGEDLGNGQALSCGLAPKPACTYEGSEMAPGDVLRIEVTVEVSSGAASSVTNMATVTGGGTEAEASAEDPTTVGSASSSFGISDFATTWSGRQAGASVNFTAGFVFNQVVSDSEILPAAYPKNIALKLPPGFVANPEATPRCTVSQASAGECPSDTAVGVAFVSVGSGVGGKPTPYSSLVYNTDPSPGQFGALTLFLPGYPLRLGIGISPDGQYGLSVEAEDLTQTQPLVSMELTLWGVPESVDGSGADHVIAGGEPSFGGAGGIPAARFLTSASDCGTMPSSTLLADSWVDSSVFVEAMSATPELTGCGKLPFDPSLTVLPDTSVANEPSGYALDLKLQQQGNSGGLGSADLKNVAVTLPQGVGISLSATNGMLACSEAQVALESPEAALCPEASKIGSVEIQTPLLAHPLDGAIYMATPNKNPPKTAFAMYLLAEEDVTGVSVKLAGQIEVNQLTGQLTVEFHELPQLPISELQLHFSSGARALLSTPETCGPAMTTAELSPWSADDAATVSSVFDIEPGAGGIPCSASRPFGPVFQAGVNATGEMNVFDSLTLSVSREDHDQEQELNTIVFETPPAVAQMFAGVPPCGEPQASQGKCSAASKVGTISAIAGLNAFPIALDGAVYLTGPYGNSEQGLSIVLPVDSGPLDLGDAVVLASVGIDPNTGRLTIASGSLPQMVEGVPLHLDALLLLLNRGEFRIASDSCESLAVTSTIAGMQGGSVHVSTDPLGASSSSCPPSEQPSSKVIPNTATPTSTVALLGTRLTTNRRGVTMVKLACKGTAPCSGKLTLTAVAKGKAKGKKGSKGTTLGVADFSIKPGASATIKLGLSAHGRSLLRVDHGRLNAMLAISKSSPESSHTYTEGVLLDASKIRGHRAH